MNSFKIRMAKTTLCITTYFLWLLFSTITVFAAPTRVGNGDDGSDLEGAEEVTSGVILDSKKEAIKLLKDLNVKGVAGLGNLIPETEKSKLYLSKMDTAAKIEADQSKFHSGLDGRVFARTFARPHAPTRFFPAALKLNTDQLVALHIHEALHRSLPAGIREDESKVSAITLAITSPETSHDQVSQTVAEIIPPETIQGDQLKTVSAQAVGNSEAESLASIPEDARVRNPSTLGLSTTLFKTPKRPSVYPVDRMYSIQSFMYPFGNSKNAFGFGIEASMIEQKNGTNMGPLGLSGRGRIWSGRAFDIELFGMTALNMLSAEEVKNSPIGRDILTLGISARKDLDMLYFENKLSYTAASEVSQTVGKINIKHEYGDIIHAEIHAGAKLWKLHVGGYTDLYLADYYRITQDPTFKYDTGRYRIISGGPEVGFVTGRFGLTANGKFILNATKDANFDTLGNILGSGAAQGSASAAVHYYF